MKKGWIFLLIFVLCIGVLVYGYADTMTELKTHVNPAPQVGDEPGLAMAALEDALGESSYPDDVLLHWLKNFYHRFFAQQFKRSCLPDGPKIGSVTLSPRGDWRMPSDACAAVWQAELDQLG